MLEIEKIKKFIQEQRQEVASILTELIKFASISEEEKDIQIFLKNKFSKLGGATLIPVSDDIKNDKDYSFPRRREVVYKGRPNLSVIKRGKGRGKSIILNAHMDVASSEGWKEAFSPRIKGDIIYGRGACDDKGSIVAIYLALKTLKKLNIELKGNIFIHLVIEEETGGNGTLAFILQRHTKADGVVDFEPTGENIYLATRGAIWFKLTVEGKKGHYGGFGEGINAIEKAMEAIRLFKDYEKRLIAESIHPLFDHYKDYERAVQLNIGTIQGGDWPSSVPTKAVVEGRLGFLPNKKMSQIKKELRDVVLNHNDEWLKSHFKLEFPHVHNDAYEISLQHPLVQTMKFSCNEMGLNPQIVGWNVSCDARLYKTRADLPVIVFGPGNVQYAHTSKEQIKISEILKAAEILTVFLIKWCGVIKK